MTARDPRTQSWVYKGGYFDAQRGHTTCPYGEADLAALWAAGYDKAVHEGLAIYPRFGTSRRSR